MCVRASGADGDASKAERQGGALFIELSLPPLPPSLASLLAQPRLASLFAVAPAADKVAVPTRCFAITSTA